MNFYKDPLLEKLRLIESRILGEALSDDEFADLQKLRAELGDDPESAKLHSEVDTVIKQRAAEFEKTGSGSTGPTTPAQDGGGEEKPEVKWPTTPDEIKAFQKLHNLKDDGLIGQKTMAALIAAGATPPPGFKPVGNKVKPKEKPPGIAPQPKPGEPAPNTMSRAGTPPELAKVDPRVNNEYWVNGTRYKFTGIGNNGTWAPNFQSTDMFGSPANRKLSREKYTGPVPGAAAQPSKPAASDDSYSLGSAMPESIDRIRHLSGL
jgi:hypothetical protein